MMRTPVTKGPTRLSNHMEATFMRTTGYFLECRSGGSPFRSGDRINRPPRFEENFDTI